MGRAKRIIPKRLPEKLKTIRTENKWTLEQMATNLEAKLSGLDYADISIYSGNIYEFEKGIREPLLPVLFAYAKLAKVSTDILIDDSLELPSKLHRFRNV